MPGVARIGDPTSHGGQITSGSTSTKADGLGVARLGDTHLCPIHGGGSIISASTKHKADGLGIARVGDSISCGATISFGSTTTFAN